MGNVSLKKNSENGVDYDIVETNSASESTATVGARKIVYVGKVAFETMSNSWKFGKQIQIVVFGKIKTIESRANNRGYERIEIALPYEVGKELILEMAKKLEPKKQTSLTEDFK